MAEATLTSGLKSFARAFPRLKLPFRDLCGVQPEPCTIACKLHDFTRVLAIQAWIRAFQSRLHRNTEYSLRDRLWNSTLKQLLDGPHTIFEAEYPTSCFKSSYRRQFVDVVVRLRDKYDGGVYNVPRERKYIPLLLVEIAKEPLDTRYARKDERKLAVEMDAALFKQMNQCGHLGEKAVRRLRVYGLLIGLCDFEVVVVYPDFGAASGHVPGRLFAMIYKSLWRYWRFSLFGLLAEAEHPA